MNNSAAEVGEIFTEAGAAFNKLADMIMTLHHVPESATGSQVKAAVKRKVIEEKPVTSSTITTQQIQPTTSNPQKVTLNMLSSLEGEVKIEPSKSEIKTETQVAKEEEKT